MTEQLSMSSGQIIGSFFQALDAALGESWMAAVSFPTTSKQKIQRYKWLGMAPAVRQWIAGRHPKGLRADHYDLENLKFEATLDIETDDLNRDNWGQIKQRITDLATRIAEHWEVLGSACLALGESELCYDGQPFFSDSHEEGGSGPQSNLLSASEVTQLDVAVPTAPTPLEMAAAIWGCISWFFTLRDDVGELLNGSARRFMVQVPVPLWVPALAACTTNLLATPAGLVTENPLAGPRRQGFEIVCQINPRLSWTDSFAILRTDAPMKPLIRQEEYPVKVSAKAEGSDYEHDTDRQQFGIKASRNVGYGFWQYALKATLS
jgi:phage major head subunit gpT-like protein